MKSTFYIIPRAYAHRSNPLQGSAGDAQLIENLREVSHALQVTGEPKTLDSLRSGHILLLVDHRDGFKNIITYSGTQIFLATRIERDLSVKPIYTTLADAQAQIMSARSIGRFVVVFTAKSTIYLMAQADGQYRQIRIEEAIPKLNFTTTDIFSSILNIERYSLANAYHQWSAPLADADIRGYTSVVRKAYADFCTAQGLDGAWVQPVAVRWGIRLWDDSLLFLSPPAILGNGVQMANEISIPLPASPITAIEACSVPISSYRVGITVQEGSAEAWDGVIKSIDIFIADSPNPIHASAPLQYRCATSQSHNHYFDFSLPRLAQSSVISSLVNPYKWRLLSRVTDLAQLRKGIFSAPNALLTTKGEGGTLTGNTFSISLQGVDSKSVSLASSSHCISAPVTSCVHNQTLYTGGGKSIVNSWWNLAHFVAGEWTNAAANAFMEVEIATVQGTVKYVKSFYMPKSALKLHSMMAFPDSRATRITIKMLRDGSVWQWQSALQSSEDGTFAYACASSLLPQSFSQSSDQSFIIPAEEGIEVSEPTLLSIFNPRNPLVPLKQLNISEGSINAIAVSVSPASGNIFTRYPLYLFTSSGIYALDATAKAPEPRCVQFHAVTSQSLVLSTNRGIVYAAHEGLYLLRGNTSKLIIDKITPLSMAYAPRFDEIWCQREPEIGVQIVNISTSRCYIRTGTVFALHPDIFMPLRIGMKNDISLINEETGISQEVRYLSYPVAAPHHFKAVRWNIISENATATLSLYGENGNSCHVGLISHIHLRGALRAPIPLALRYTPMRLIRAQIRGSFPTGTLIQPIALS